MTMKQSWLGVAAVATMGCRSPGPAPSVDASTMALDASTAEAAAQATPRALPLPLLAEGPKITILQLQGGPSNLRCGGVVYQLTLDFETNAWTYGTCTARNTEHSEMANAPLTMTHGTLSSADRARVDGAYAKLTSTAQKTCAADAGMLSLSVTSADGGATTWFDDHSGCTKLPGAAIHGLPDFVVATLPTLDAGAPAPDPPRSRPR